MLAGVEKLGKDIDLSSKSHFILGRVAETSDIPLVCNHVTSREIIWRAYASGRV